MQQNPTTEFYALLNQAYAHFNQWLFDNRLPWCMLTLQRSRNTMGYFSPERWVHRNGFKAHEIALNPSYFARHLIIDVLQTLVHEQCHLWQYVYGINKSRSGYHNREWAGKMDEIGLVPSDTGEMGGRKTGQSMSDYPKSEGRFLQACIALCNQEYQLEWIDTEPAWQESCQPRVKQEQEEEKEQSYLEQIRLHAPALLQPVPTETATENINWAPPEETKRLSKSKYTCFHCETNVWGKPGLNIVCGNCDRQFVINPV
jgi:predicted SprT family Zn-dependent metalloprotease